MSLMEPASGHGNVRGLLALTTHFHTAPTWARLEALVIGRLPALLGSTAIGWLHLSPEGGLRQARFTPVEPGHAGADEALTAALAFAPALAQARARLLGSTTRSHRWLAASVFRARGIRIAVTVRWEKDSWSESCGVVFGLVRNHLVVACGRLRERRVAERRIVAASAWRSPRSAPPTARLSPREREVAHWGREGKTNGEIGLILGISKRTVDKHFENILRKLGLENRVQLANRLLAAA